MYVCNSVNNRELYAHYQTFPEKKSARPARVLTTFITLNIKLKKKIHLCKKYIKSSHTIEKVSMNTRIAQKNTDLFLKYFNFRIALKNRWPKNVNLKNNL